MNTRYITLGTFVVVTLGAFTWLAMQLGLSDRGGTHYTVETADAAGLVEGNSVRIAGVEVGKVEQIRVKGNIAVIDIRVRNGTNVWAEACAAVHIKGMLGEKYLGITQAMDGAPMPANSTFACVTPTVDFDNALNATRDMVYGKESLLPHIGRIAKRMDTLTASLDEGPGLPRERLDNLLKEVETITTTTRAMLEENRQDLRGMAEGTNTLLHDPRISRILGNTDKLVATLNRDVPGLLDRADRLLARLDKASEALSPDNIAKFERILSNGDAAVANLNKISGDFKDIAKDLKPALTKLAPLMKNLSIIAERGAAVTFDGIKRFFQIDGFRVHLFKDRKAVKSLGAEDDDKAAGFEGP